MTFYVNDCIINLLYLERDEAEELVSKTRAIQSGNKLFERLDKLYKMMKKEESFNSLKNRLNMSDNELFGIIDMLKQYGREIDIVDIDNELVVRKNIQRRQYARR